MQRLPAQQCRAHSIGRTDDLGTDDSSGAKLNLSAFRRIFAFDGKYTIATRAAENLYDVSQRNGF
jgi:hypothetical protein